MAEVQTPAGASARDTVLMTLSIVVLLAGIGAFYWFDEQALPIRIAMVIVGLAAGAGLVWFTWYGREFWQFVLAARIELRKGGWAGRGGKGQNTYFGFGFAIVMGLFFWLLDMGLTFLTRLLGGQAG